MAAALMTAFAERTGIPPSTRPPRRYLWTDAFAVCNFLGSGSRDLALALVDQVHHVLGRHRADDVRSGWISGLAEHEGEAHPTKGGLRIGKPLPERRPDERFDERLEWERDGQYFHYLTKWMQALDRIGEPVFDTWARELAATAHAAFTWAPSPAAPKRMYWKMSIDLRRPLVPSMGHHDPLDGLVTYLQLRAHRGRSADAPDLEVEIEETMRMVDGLDPWTDDPLGIGELLGAAARLEQLVRTGADDGRLLPVVLAAAASGLDAWLHERPLDLPARARLAFRELGLAIGLHAVERMWIALERDPGPFAMAPAVRLGLERLVQHVGVAETIEACWREPRHRTAENWRAHEDINDVMLATSLAPSGYLPLA